MEKCNKFIRYINDQKITMKELMNPKKHLCPKGHNCNMEKSYRKKTKCKICNKKGKYEDGAYVCK